MECVTLGYDRPMTSSAPAWRDEDSLRFLLGKGQLTRDLVFVGLVGMIGDDRS